MSVETGNRIAVHYLAMTRAGKTIADNRAASPLEFVVGSGETIPGIERGVIGMTVGETRRLVIEAEEAYGASRSPVVRVAPRHALPKDVRVGDLVRIALGNVSAALWVVALEGDEARLSTEHAMAGETVIVELSVAGILSTS